MAGLIGRHLGRVAYYVIGMNLFLFFAPVWVLVLVAIWWVHFYPGPREVVAVVADPYSVQGLCSANRQNRPRLSQR